MLRFKLINYFDVWGDKKHGWSVNNLCEEGTIELPEKFTDRDIVKALKEFGFLKKHVRTNMLNIQDDGEMIFISQRSNDCPVCRLEEIR